VILESELGSFKVIGNDIIQQITHEFLLAFPVNMALSCIISEIKRDTCQKSRFCHTPVSMPLLGAGVPLEYCHKVWYGQCIMAWLPDGEKSLRMCLFLFTEYTNMTGGWTDRQTLHD